MQKAEVTKEAWTSGWARGETALGLASRPPAIN